MPVENIYSKPLTERYRDVSHTLGAQRKRNGEGTNEGTEGWGEPLC